MLSYIQSGTCSCGLTLICQQSFEMEDQKQLKQEFLRDQILEKGYNAQHFLEYLTSLRQGGQNIDVWSLKEIQDIVEQYKIRPSIQIHQHEASGEGIPGVQSGDRIPEISTQKTRQCRKFEKFLQRNLVNMEIQVENPEIETKGGFLGFGSTSVLWYSVKTPIVQNEVRRSDEDFDWFRATLVRLYPNRIIPPLPKFKPVTTGDTKALFKRGQMIKVFLQNLTQCVVLTNTKLTVAFLTWGDYPRFQAFKRDQTTIISPFSPEQFITELGTVDLVISKKNQEQLIQIDKYNSGLKQIYDQIKEQAKTVMRNFDDLTASIYRIGNSFAIIQEKHSNLCTAVPQLSNQAFSQLIIGLNNCLIEWGKSFSGRRKAVQKHISLLFKYTSDQAEATNEFFNTRAKYEEEYQKYRYWLEKKKEKVYPYSQKWEIAPSVLAKINVSALPKQQALKHILPTQTRISKGMKEMLGGLNSACISEFKRMQPLCYQRMVTAFKAFGTSVLESNKHETEVLTRFIGGSY